MIPLPKTTLILLVGCLAFVSIQGSEEINDLDEEQKKALLDGEVLFLEPDGKNMLAAVVRIEADPKLVWEVMQDHERVPKYVKELRAIKVLEEGKNWKVIEHKLRMHTLLPLFHYVFREEYGPGYSINFRRVSGAFKELTGSWKLVSGEDDDHALLMYTTYVEFGWFIPKSWVNKGINKRVPALLNAFRDEVYFEVESRKSSKEDE